MATAFGAEVVSYRRGEIGVQFVSPPAEVLERLARRLVASVARAPMPLLTKSQSFSASVRLLRRGPRMSSVIPSVSSPVEFDAESTVSSASYAFTAPELATLGRWYSALRFAFPGAEALLAVDHRTACAGIHIYNRMGGITPSCLVSKRVRDGHGEFYCVFEPGERRGPFATLAEITAPHMRAIGLPDVEAQWLDLAGWQRVLIGQVILDHPRAGK
jgi:hypothetical protein